MKRKTFALLLLGAVACSDAGGESGAIAEPTVRDSAGVTIMENPLPPDAGGALTLAAEPEVTIGVLEGAEEYQLFEVGQPVRLSDGRIAIPNAGSEIRYYSPDGRYIRTTGAEGDGPGEFRSVSILGRLPGDTLLIHDRGNRRLSVVDEDGDFVRSLALRGEARFPFASGMTDAEHVVLRSNSGFGRAGEAPQGLLQDTAHVFVVPWRDGIELREPSFSVLGNDLFLSRGDNWVSTQTLLLRGYMMLIVQDGAIYLAPADRYEVQVLGPDGVPTRIVRRAHEPIPVTTAMWDAEVERRLEGADDEDWKRRQRDILADMPKPSHLPARGMVTADAAGRIWVQRYAFAVDEEPVSPSEWDVFDANGHWIAVIELPPGFRTSEIGRDYVLGVHHDELEVPQVRLYRLESSGAGE